VEVELAIRHFTARDGQELAFREVGDGRPLVLLHGFTGDGRQWIDHAHTAVFAERGYRVIMPDLRGHGASTLPHQTAAYPPDVLAEDGLALVRALGLADSEGGYDLAGYSLGARVVLRMLVRGARPARAVVAGQGLDATSAATDRTGRYRRIMTAMLDGTPLEPEERVLADWLTQSGANPRALLLVLDTLVGTPPEELGQISVPTLVLIGERDPRASADALAAAIPGARFARMPGDHDAFSRPELTAAILDFLDG
jgi:pimeloyl-ACP methyl ester carboxylesterase